MTPQERKKKFQTQKRNVNAVLSQPGQTARIRPSLWLVKRSRPDRLAQASPEGALLGQNTGSFQVPWQDTQHEKVHDCVLN